MKQVKINQLPERNQMQAEFLDPDYALAAVQNVYAARNREVDDVKFEVSGWDVLMVLSLLDHDDMNNDLFFCQGAISSR